MFRYCTGRLRKDKNCRPGVGEHRDVFLFDVFQQFRDCDLQIAVDADSQRLIERNDHRRGIFFVAVYGGPPPGRIHDPVFPNTSLRVKSVFRDIIHLPAAGRDDLHNEVRCTADSLWINLTPVADNGDIRFYVSRIVRLQVYGKR